MTAQEQTILDKKIDGVNGKIVWGFVCSLAIGIFTACACYFGIKQDIRVMQVEISYLKQQISEMKAQPITKNH